MYLKINIITFTIYNNNTFLILKKAQWTCPYSAIRNKLRAQEVLQRHINCPGVPTAVTTYYRILPFLSRAVELRDTSGGRVYCKLELELCYLLQQLAKNYPISALIPFSLEKGGLLNELCSRTTQTISNVSKVNYILNKSLFLGHLLTQLAASLPECTKTNSNTD